MNRTYRVILPVLLFFLFLSGCSREEREEEAGYMIYYDTPEGTQLQTSSYVPAAQTFEEIMEELAGELAKAPAGFESVLKDGVKIQGYQRGIDALRIDFSKEYYDLDNVDEVLLRAAVVKTFSQVPGVTRVMITVDGAQLLDDEGNPVPAMDREDFINTKEGGINSYQYAALSLYFVNPGSGKLSKEIRNLHYSSNMVLENVVTEQLIQGPEESGLVPVFLDTVKIISVHVQDEICVIDFDSAVNQAPVECTADAETVLYALVNSICDTCDGVEGVRIRINGESDTVFRNEIPLNQVFYMEMSEVEDYTEADASAGVFASVEPESSGEDGGTESEGSGGTAEDGSQKVSGTSKDNPQQADTSGEGDVQQEGGSDEDVRQQEGGSGEDSPQQVSGSGGEIQEGGSADSGMQEDGSGQDDDPQVSGSGGEIQKGGSADNGTQAGDSGQDDGQQGGGSGGDGTQQGGDSAGDVQPYGGGQSSSGMVGVDPALTGS